MSHSGGHIKSFPWCYTIHDVSELPLISRSWHGSSQTVLQKTRGLTKGLVSMGGKGALSMLTTMPLDILYDIFRHLHPEDMLHLARTTKRMREILMSRDAKSVWKASLRTVFEFPDCPPDLTEPQYASLAFDKHCYFCLAPNVEDVLWTCRTRCCKRCINRNFVTEDELELWMPSTLYSKRYDAIFPYIVYPIPKQPRNKPGRVLYFLPVAACYFRELEGLGLSDHGSNSLQEWIRNKKAKQAERIAHAALCERWSTYWVYRGSQECDLAIIIVLVLLLIYLWKDKFL